MVMFAMSVHLQLYLVDLRMRRRKKDIVTYSNIPIKIDITTNMQSSQCDPHCNNVAYLAKNYEEKCGRLLRHLQNIPHNQKPCSFQAEFS